MEKMIGDRISVLDERKLCSIIIYPKRVLWKESILFVWLLAFSIIGVYVLYLLFFGMDTIDNSLFEGDKEEILKGQKIYLLVFAGFWMYFEYKVLKGFLWLVRGKELIRITKEEISIKNDIFGYGKAKKYFTENTTNFELVEHKTVSFGFDYENAFWRQGTDSLIFDINKKSISFAKKIPEKEANLLMRLMKDRIKKLKKG